MREFWESWLPDFWDSCYFGGDFGELYWEPFWEPFRLQFYLTNYLMILGVLLGVNVRLDEQSEDLHCESGYALQVAEFQGIVGQVIGLGQSELEAEH
jgi:hypothetical protein